MPLTDSELLELEMLVNQKYIDDNVESCKKSFEHYIKYIQKEFYNYKPNLYNFQLEIVKTLERVLSGEITRLIINIPPRYRKTEIAVKMFVSYCLAMNPKAKFIHLSYSDDLALDNSEVIKGIVYSDAYQKLFPVKLKKDSTSKKKWYTQQGGGVYATSAGGQVTGFGAGKSIEDYNLDELEDEEIDEFFKNTSFAPGEFGGAIIIDDPNKPEDALSLNILNKINERFDSTIKNRVNSRYTPIIVIQQRTAKNDLSGFLLEQSDEWHHLNLKAVKDDGSVLCDKFHTYEELMTIKRNNEKVFNNQYQQDPKPLEGLMYQLQKVDSIEPKGINIAVCDPAADGSCFTATMFAYVHANKVWVYDMVYTQENSDITIAKNIHKAKEHKPSMFWIEKDGIGSIYGRQVNAKYPLVRQFNAKGNKDERIFDKSYIISNYFRFLRNTNNLEYEKAIRNLEYYDKSGKNEFKDAADALTSLAQICIKNNFIDIYNQK